MGSQVKCPRKKVGDLLDLCNNAVEDLSKIDRQLKFKETKVLIKNLTSCSNELRSKYDNYVHTLEDDCLQVQESFKKKKKEKEAKYEKNIEVLSEKKEETNKLLNEKNNVLEEISNKQVENVMTEKHLLSKESAVKFKETDNYVRDKATFALLSRTLNMKWNYTCNKDEIKGCIASKKDFKPFSINLKMHDKSYVANYLWDLIELS